MKRYYRITYQWPVGFRSAVEATVAVEEQGTKQEQMSKAIDKLRAHLSREVTLLAINKLPSNYKAQDDEIIE
jgi:hypothetical protein